MTPLESIIYMIWRGFAVGVLISAPMGPVGILCIQRTLDKGRHAGFYTGVGAAISDIFYCLLTGFGLSFIEEFIERNQNVIQLIGSVVLIAFSIYLFRKDPSSPLRRPVPQNVSVRKNILGGFLFTFSNPLIIFLIIGLFARFNFTSPDIKGAYYAVGYLFIVVGALAWWYGITYAIEKVRSRFNMRAMKIMNITIGIVILIFACVGIYSSITGLTSTDAKAAGPVKITYLPADGPEGITTLEKGERLTIPVDGASEFRLDFKLRVNERQPQLFGGRAFQPFTVSLHSSGGGELRLSQYVTESPADALTSRPAMICDASFIRDEGGIGFYRSEPLADGLDLPAGWNHYRLTLSPAADLILAAGSRNLRPLATIPAHLLPGAFVIDSISIAAPAEVMAELRDVRLSLPPEPLVAAMSVEEAMERLRLSNDPVEGLWSILDWSIDTKTTRRGGDYRLAIVRAPGGWYDMLYLSGAETLASKWTPGMVKGRLLPTGMPGIWDLIWLDAEGREMRRGLRGQLLAGESVMTLHFPYLDASIRLYRQE